jgi:GT2 family glycosyltransferase
VIVPSFNQGRFLAATLDSILAQDHRPLEVIVVDGASSDGSVEILEAAAAEHPELRFVSEPDDGPEEAINKGLAMARGEIAAIQSSDDIYHPGAIRAAVDALARHPEVGLVYGDTEAIDAHGRRVAGPTSYLDWTLERYLCGSTFIPQSSAFFRTELARRIGGVRKRYFVFDVDLWLRMMLAGAGCMKLGLVLSAYREHEGRRDRQAAEIFASHRRMLRETPQLRHGRLRTRLAAFAGRRMLTQHYNPSHSPHYAALQLWLGILAYPPAIRALSKPRMLVPPPPTLSGARRRLRQLRAARSQA